MCVQLVQTLVQTLDLAKKKKKKLVRLNIFENRKT